MKLYVQNDSKMVYEVTLKHINDLYCNLQLDLICGWDYISEELDIQGYVGADNFVEDVQYEVYTLYPLSETIIERLEEEGLKRVDLEDIKTQQLSELMKHI